MDAHGLRVVTYNILSSALADPGWFTRCDPQHLVAETRLARVLVKLGLEMDMGAVILLQEVSRDWSGKLHAFFHQRNYTFIDSLYGGSSSGYMGVGIAFPNSTWSVVDVDIRRVSETKAEWHLPSRDQWRPARGEPREGDWTCPACSAHVFAGKVACYKCKTAKPAPPEPASGIKALLPALWAWLSRAAPGAQAAPGTPAQALLGARSGQDSSQGQDLAWYDASHTSNLNPNPDLDPNPDPCPCPYPYPNQVRRVAAQGEHHGGGAPAVQGARGGGRVVRHLPHALRLHPAQAHGHARRPRDAAPPAAGRRHHREPPPPPRRCTGRCTGTGWCTARAARRPAQHAVPLRR